MLDISVLTSTSGNPTLISIAYALMLAFVLGTLVAIVYIGTFQGLSYSRNFVHCLVLCPIVASIVMQAIGDNLARGLGMVGAISLLRFRSNIKDPRDMFFLFASLAIGVACGVHSYAIGLIGGLGFCGAVFVLSRTPFTQGNQFDGLLRLNLPVSAHCHADLEKTLIDYCRDFSLVTVRQMAQGDRMDFSYQIRLKQGRRYDELLRKINELTDAKGVNLLLQESTVEV